MISILYLLLGTQPRSIIDTTVITIAAVVGGVIGLVLITVILLCVLSTLYISMWSSNSSGRTR